MSETCCKHFFHPATCLFCRDEEIDRLREENKTYREAGAQALRERDEARKDNERLERLAKTMASSADTWMRTCQLAEHERDEARRKAERWRDVAQSEISPDGDVGGNWELPWESAPRLPHEVDE